MNRILFYVNPGSDEEYSRIVTLAADLIEAATYAADEPLPRNVRLGIVAPTRACIEIGLAMLGRGEARTVEQGRRSQSPVRLFPFVVDSDLEDAGALRAGLDYLRAAGAIEGSDDANSPGEPLRQFRRADAAMSAARQIDAWEGIVVLGENVDVPLVATGVDREDQPPSVIRPIDSKSVREEAEAYVRLSGDELREPDVMREVRLRAAGEALQFARLVDQLRLDSNA